MTSSQPISRRRLLLRGTATAAAVAAGLPLLDACTSQEPSAGPTSSNPAGTALPSTVSGSPGMTTTNVHVSNNQYGVHIEPSVAANPRTVGALLAACQVSPGADPEFISTYISLDAGATWEA